MFGCMSVTLLRKYYTKRDIFMLMDLMNIFATVILYFDNLKLFLLGRCM